MAKRHLTLDIGASSIALAEYEVGKEGLVLLNYGIAPLAAPIDSGNADVILSPALLEIVREKGIKPGPVAISVSGQMVFPRFASIPMAGGDDKFEQMVRYEIEQNIPFPIDEMICDSQVLGDNENGDKSVMIVAAKTEQIEEITSAVRAAGFVPDLVDAAPIAISNVLKNAGADQAGCVVILDIGSKATALVIVDGDKLYNRSIPVAGNAITRDISNALGCSSEEAEQIKCESGYVALGGVVEDEDETRDRISKVCRAVMTRLHAEISRSINFYRSQQGGGMPVKLYLTGGSALLPQIDRFFSESLNLEVEFFNPFASIGVGPLVDASALEHDGAILSATAGLALHEAGLARFAINLLPPSLLKERADVAKIPFVAAGAAALVAALVMVLLSVNHGTAVAKATLEGVQVEASRLQNFDNRIKAANDKAEAATAAADELKDLFVRRGFMVSRLNAMRTALGSEMWIEKWDGDRVTIRGWADDLKELVAKSKATGAVTASEVVVGRLKASPVVDPASVSIAEMTALGKDGELEQFVVIVKFGKGGVK